MISLDTLNLNSIRGRLWLGFGVLVAMLVVAGVVARRSFAGISETITQSLAEVQQSRSSRARLFGEYREDDRGRIALSRRARLHRTGDV